MFTLVLKALGYAVAGIFTLLPVIFPGKFNKLISWLTFIGVILSISAEMLEYRV
jgi:hypothetical protein